MDEQMEIIISKDKLLAEIIFYPPKNNGKLLEKDYILKKILALGMNVEVDLLQIENFIQNRHYQKRYIIAKGKEAENGKDGYLKVYIDIKEKKVVPKVLEDGSIDYKNIELFQSVEEEQILIEKIMPISGKTGKDIFGRLIIPKKGKEILNFPKGKNTKISTDGKFLLSNIKGYVFYKNNKIDILPVLEINSHINNTTGNIDFLGSVVIHGNVLTGFEVKAEGDIFIYGFVEGATLTAKGDIFITKGIHGRGKAKIYAGKSINANFIENANLLAEEDILASSIIHCQTKCKKNLRLIGKKGTIFGGLAIVGGDIYVRNIGSGMSNDTEIIVGIDPYVLEKYKESLKNIDINYDKYTYSEKIVETLTKKDIDELSVDKRKLLKNSIKEKIEYKKTLNILKIETTKLSLLFTKRMAKIETLGTVYGGSKITINDAIIFIKEDIKCCTIKNIDGKAKVIK